MFLLCGSDIGRLTRHCPGKRLWRTLRHDFRKSRLPFCDYWHLYNHTDSIAQRKIDFKQSLVQSLVNNFKLKDESLWPNISLRIETSETVGFLISINWHWLESHTRLQDPYTCIHYVPTSCSTFSTCSGSFGRPTRVICPPFLSMENVELTITLAPLHSHILPIPSPFVNSMTNLKSKV